MSSQILIDFHIHRTGDGFEIILGHEVNARKNHQSCAMTDSFPTARLI
jgi:hypothetical protein